jgi:hypothetical protein
MQALRSSYATLSRATAGASRRGVLADVGQLSLPAQVLAQRGIGGGVPDQWGQPATGGTKFLGTPANYMEVCALLPRPRGGSCVRAARDAAVAPSTRTHTGGRWRAH